MSYGRRPLGKEFWSGYKVDGHGRYSGFAPRWGEFYERAGLDPDRNASSWEGRVSHR